ncbi:hydroxymyristoyl-ACP dehydratase [Nitrogeniibacter mangrovi]|uniref:Hydroxymyristoyl-ACP dehydratase n=1 Tax=Nitrogeniibacter mangrovi TaxID=2016596 RepID=A0A6C1B8H5_9RHOO|nr:hydroxymyristoyl-ACP dehydratase [Nitrogeniibacter mangrovi]
MHDRDWIATRIPHTGSMCLLDTVEACDEARIRCRASSHRDPAHPLRNGERLGAAVGVEYAAQAMAVHGAILQPPTERPRVGFLASVRGVELLVDRLDTIDAPLCVEAERLSGNESTILYRFEVSADGQVLLRGRAAVIVAPRLPGAAGDAA